MDSSDVLWQSKEWTGKLSGSQRSRKRVWRGQKGSLFMLCVWMSPLTIQSVVWLVSAARCNASSVNTLFDMGRSGSKANGREAEMLDVGGGKQHLDGSMWRFPAQNIRAPDSMSVNGFCSSKHLCSWCVDLKFPHPSMSVLGGVAITTVP
jgi:hypothetical protein